MRHKMEWYWKCIDCGSEYYDTFYKFCYECGRSRPFQVRMQGFEDRMQQAFDAVRNPPLEHRVEALEKLYEKTVMLEESLAIGQRWLCERIERLEQANEDEDEE